MFIRGKKELYPMENMSDHLKIIGYDGLTLFPFFLEGSCSPGANSFDAVNNSCHAEPVDNKIKDRKDNNIA